MVELGDAQDDDGDLEEHGDPLEGPGSHGDLYRNQYEKDMVSVHSRQLCVHKLYSERTLTDNEHGDSGPQGQQRTGPIILKEVGALMKEHRQVVTRVMDH